MNAIYFNR